MRYILQGGLVAGVWEGSTGTCRSGAPRALQGGETRVARSLATINPDLFPFDGRLDRRSFGVRPSALAALAPQTGSEQGHPAADHRQNLSRLSNV